MSPYNQIVSPRVYGLILTSPLLRNRVLPEGLGVSPYEVLDYDATLVLHDRRGSRATFKRRQRIRFLQDRVSAILDHFWGNGVLLTNYRNTAGSVGDSFKDEGKRHLVIGLKRDRARGETLDFDVEREAMESFTGKEGVLETRIDHPIGRLAPRIVFPKGRPVQCASLHYPDAEFDLPIVRLTDGRTLVGFELTTPKANIPYMIRWRW